MDIQPLNGILNGIGSGGEWDEQRQLQRLISQWEAIVGATVAQHSCPLEVRNGVLQVATSTAVWAQNLSFERRRILKKLNQRAHFKILGLKEIRFSTAQWHNRPGSSGATTVDKRLNSYQQQVQWQQHPSRLPPPQSDRPSGEPAPSAGQAFDRWSQRRQQQINQVPPCPQCRTPSPEGELQRWGVCAFCMTQRWEAEKKANQPDGSQEAETWQKGPPSSITVEEARQAEKDRRSPDPLTQDKPLPDQQSAKSPPPPLTSKPSVEPSRPPAQKLQPLAGLPPVAWPSPTAPAERQGNSDASFTSPISFQEGLSQDPALTGPLAPLQPGEQSPGPVGESFPLPALSRDRSLGTPQQAAWAQAFQGLQSQESQRQQQEAEREQRMAARVREVRGDSHGIMASGRKKPMLKKKRPTPPQA